MRRKCKFQGNLCKVTKTCTLTLFLKSQFTLFKRVNSILKRSVSMKQISLGADTEAKISILTGSNFDQYCTDRAKNYLEHCNIYILQYVPDTLIVLVVLIMMT